MTFEKASKDTLRFLFTEFLKGPAVLYPINKTFRAGVIDPIEFSDYLLDRQWIRDRWVYPDNTVACRITIKGIEQIDPVFVRTKLRQVIGGLGDAGGSKPLLDVLAHKLEEYSITMDLVKQLEDIGLIRILHPKNEIFLELTSDGWRVFENGSKTFFTLMTY